MSHYRIKIEERNNGDKLYIPQVCRLEITGRWVKRQKLVWYNILISGSSFSLSQTNAAKYGNEELALKMINDYKNKDIIEEGKKVKSTTYKMID